MENSEQRKYSLELFTSVFLRNERHSILWPLGANKIRDYSNIDLANLLQFSKQYAMKSKNIHLLISVLAS